MKIFKVGFRKYIIETDLNEKGNKEFNNGLREMFPKIKFIVLNKLRK